MTNNISGTEICQNCHDNNEIEYAQCYQCTFLMDKSLWQKLIYYNVEEEYNKIKIVQDNEKLFNIYNDKCKDIKTNNNKYLKINKNYNKKKKLCFILFLIAFSLALLFSILYICIIIKNKKKNTVKKNSDIIGVDSTNTKIKYAAILIYKTNQLNEKINLISNKSNDNNKLGFYTRERTKFNLIDLEKNIYINSSDYTFENIGTHLVKLEFKENIKDFSFMFYECKNLVSINDNFNVEESIIFKSMFNGCKSLTYIYII